VSVLIPYLPVSRGHNIVTSVESHMRLEYICQGLDARGIDYRSTNSTHVPEHIMSMIHQAFHIVHGQDMLTHCLPSLIDGVSDDCYSCGDRTRKIVYESIVTSCTAVMNTVHSQVPTFAAVRPPGHHARTTTPMGFCWRNNILIASIFGTLFAPTVIKKIMIFDMDLHHGGGIESIISSAPFKSYCLNKDIQIVYYSVYHKNAYDSQQDETHNLLVRRMRRRSNTQIIRRYSSTPSRWTPAKTQSRLSETQNFLKMNGASFDIIFVAAGFDHCRGEGFTSDDHLWSVNQLHELGTAIKEAASKTTIGYPIACLEGGYKKLTMTTFVPVFLLAIGIIPTVLPRVTSDIITLFETGSDEDTESDEDIRTSMQTEFKNVYNLQ